MRHSASMSYIGQDCNVQDSRCSCENFSHNWLFVRESIGEAISQHRGSRNPSWDGNAFRITGFLWWETPATGGCPTLEWRHKGLDSVSNHQPHDCLLNLYSDADQRKHQSSASMPYVREIHGGPVNSPHKLPVTRKMFPFMTSSWYKGQYCEEFWFFFLLLAWASLNQQLPVIWEPITLLWLQ